MPASPPPITAASYARVTGERSPGVSPALPGEELVELSLVGVVIEKVVELGARLHERHDAPLGALASQRLVHLQRRRVHGAERGERIERDGHAGARELFPREERGGAELRDVGQDGYADGVDEAAV